MDILPKYDSAPLSMGEYVASPADQRSSSRRSYNDEKSQLLSPVSKRLPIDSIEKQVEFVGSESTGTVLGSAMNLTNTVLGSGTLAVPFALASSGWLLGNVIMVIIALLTRYSVQLLLSASEVAGARCAKTYESLGHYTMGMSGTYLAEFTFIFGGFGTLVSYFIFATDLISVVCGVSPDNRYMVTIACLVFAILPLSLSRYISKLQAVSALAVVSIGYVVVFIVATCISTDTSNVESVHAVNFDSNSVYTVTLLIGAFACHNTALPVYDELQDRTLKKMDKAVIGAIAFAFGLYEVIGLAGYLQFGAATEDNILLNFDLAYAERHPSLQVPLVVGQLCMAVALLLTAPVALWPFRSCLLSVYLRWKNGGVQTPSYKATNMEFRFMTLASLTLIVFCSIFVPSVKVPLSIVGSVAGSLLIFIMPSLFYMLLHDGICLSKANVGPLLMLALGLCEGLLGLSLTLYNLTHE